LSKKSLEYKQFNHSSGITQTMDLVLASTSSYRHELLKRLQIPFTCVEAAGTNPFSPKS